jgi:cytoskeletal protein RodZ
MEPRDRTEPRTTPPRRLRHIDPHRRDRANNRVRRTTQVSVATAAVVTGVLVGFIAVETPAKKLVLNSPSGTSGTAQSPQGTSAGQAAGSTPPPAASQPPTTTTTLAPSSSSPPATTYSPPTTTYTPPAVTYTPPPVVSSGGS